MKPAALCLLLLAATSASALAQDRTAYSLNEGEVDFSVPAGWIAIMEKTDGNPQAIAFQVPDPGAQASNDSADVTVKTRRLAAASGYAATVADELDRARAQDGYENDANGTSADTHRYFVQRAGTRYQVRDSFRLLGNIAVEVRCRRPVLATTPASWNASFDAGCDSVVASLAQ